jgi:patatin-like phospholipase/acyl hydrolase
MNVPVKPYRILSIDGGGLRGVIPLTILERLDVSCPRWREGINMFAGTSTGGLIALGLASGMSPSALLDVYMAKGGFIFDRSLWREVKSLGEVTGPKYDSANREKVCQDVLGTKRLADLRSPDGARGHVVVTSFDLDDRTDPDPATRRWKAKIFHNMPTRDDSGDDSEYAYRVAMRTSAAPTYFPSYDGFVDGGGYLRTIQACAL